MATIGGPNSLGLFRNADFRLGDNTNFTFGTYVASGSNTGGPYIQMTGGAGATSFSTEYYEVNTSSSYQMITYARTFVTGSASGSLAGGHIGIACYDKYFNFIGIESLGGIANTTLSRNLTAGDQFAYVTSNSGWSTSATSTTRYFLLFPATHPDYSTPYTYTRIGLGDYTITYTATGPELMPEGDYRLTLSSVFPNIGYATPAGTPVSNGQSGGTFNYVLGNPNYPLTWTQFSSGIFTGESRATAASFRFGTKYIRFLILRNYNARFQVPQDHVWGLSQIFFGRVIDGKDYRNML